MPYVNEITLLVAVLMATATVVRVGFSARGALADAGSASLRSWFAPATIALLVVPLVAAAALAVYVSIADAPRLRLSHGVLVLGLWSASGVLGVASMALRSVDRSRRWIQLAAVVVGAAAATVTPIGGFTRTLTAGAVALAPAAGVLLVVAAAVSAMALRSSQRVSASPDAAVRARRANGRALASIAVLLAYLLVTNHVPLSPWNALSGSGQWLSSVAAVAPFGLVALAIWARHALAIAVGALWAVVWFGMQLVQWWVPYLFGPTPLHRSFDWYVAGGYEATLTILPVIGDRPVPDLQHLVLQVLSIVVIATTTRAALCARGVRSST